MKQHSILLISAGLFIPIRFRGCHSAPDTDTQIEGEDFRFLRKYAIPKSISIKTYRFIGGQSG